MNDTYVTVTGNLVADPVPRTSASGVDLTNIRIACTSRRRRSDGGYEDGPTSFFNVTGFRSLGLNMAESLHKGDLVLVSGRLTIRTWQRPDSSWASSADIEASHIGPDLTRGVCKFSKVNRSSERSAPGEDPWSVNPDEVDAQGHDSQAQHAPESESQELHQAASEALPEGYEQVDPSTGESVTPTESKGTKRVAKSAA